ADAASAGAQGSAAATGAALAYAVDGEEPGPVRRLGPIDGLAARGGGLSGTLGFPRGFGFRVGGGVGGFGAGVGGLVVGRLGLVLDRCPAGRVPGLVLDRRLPCSLLARCVLGRCCAGWVSVRRLRGLR